MNAQSAMTSASPAAVPTDRRRWVRIVALAIAATVAVLMAGAIASMIWLMPRVDQYRPELTRALSRLLARPVTIGRLQAQWQQGQPMLQIQDLRIQATPGTTVLTLPSIQATLSWSSLWVGEPRFSRIALTGLSLSASRLVDGGFEVAGWRWDPRQPPTRSRMAEWLLRQGSLTIGSSTVQWHDQQRAAPSLRIAQAEVTLHNSGRRHRISLRFNLPELHAQRFELRGDLRHPLFAKNIADVRQWEGELYAEAAALDVATLRPWVSSPLLWGAQGNARLWMGINRSRIDRVTSDLSLHNVIPRDNPAASPLSLQGRIGIYRNDQGYSLYVRQALLGTAALPTWRLSNLSARIEKSRLGLPAGGTLNISELELKALTQWLRAWSPSEAWQQPLVQLEPQGRLSDLQLHWRLAPNAAAFFGLPHRLSDVRDLRWSTRFENFGWAAGPAPILPPEVTGVRSARPHLQPARPGAHGLSGIARGTLLSGELNLDSRQASLAFPGVFENPEIELKRLRANLNWHFDSTARRWQANLTSLQFEGVGATGVATAQWRQTPQGGPGWLALQGQLTHAEATSVARYLPLVVPSGARYWLEHALLAGTSDDLRFQVQGDLRRFPFALTPGPATAIASAAVHSAEPAAEIFKVWGRVHDAVLDYGVPAHPAEPPGIASATWPRLNGVVADLLFERDHMRITGVRAEAQGVALSQVIASIPKLSAGAVLQISGHAAGPSQSLLNFVEQSPLRVATHRVLSEVQAQGQAQLDLQMELPLADLTHATVAGDVQWRDNDIRWRPSWPLATRTQGKLEFTRDHYALQEVSGGLLGGTIRLATEAQTSTDATLLRIEGNAHAEALASYLPGSIGQRLQGQLVYRAGVTLRPDRAPVLMLESDLAGIAIDAPAPLGKRAEQRLAMRVRMESQVSSPTAAAISDFFAIDVGNTVAARFELQRPAEEGAALSIFKRGVLAWNAVPELPEEGLLINLDTDRLDLDAWRKVLSEASPKAGLGQTSSAHGVLPAADLVAVRAKQVLLGGKQVDDVVFGASRNGEVWQLNIDSDQIAGYATWRMAGLNAPFGAITARLARLIIPRVDARLEEPPGETESAGIEGVPGIDLVAEHLEIGGRALGRLEVDAVNSRSVRLWTLRKLSLTTPEATLTAHGTWGGARAMPASAISTNLRLTRLDFNLRYNDLGRLLDRLGFKQVMRRGTGALTGQLEWQGPPVSLDIASLSGQLALEADKGQFLKAEPGLAKLLGVLSLQSLPRRITLDFRDVFSEGFAFDTVRANVTANAGVATTQDFKMTGVNATVVMAGKADLSRETQSLRVLVLPEINAGTASILYGLVINPAVGFGTFLAQMVLRSPLRKALSYEYTIEGTWVDPIVERARRKPTTSQPAPDN